MGQAQEKAAEKNQKLKTYRERLADQRRQLERAREKGAEKNQKLKTYRERLEEQERELAGLRRKLSARDAGEASRDIEPENMVWMFGYGRTG